MTAPLAGLRVIDAANWLAAPAAAGLMSDLGADVIKIEPPTGDTYRFVLRTMSPEADVLAGWQNDNRGKRGVALDLDKPAAREVLLTLCEQADVLITNFIPSRVARYELDYETVRARNPRIIYTAFSGYGTRGPDANRLGFDLLAFWARSGIQSLIGDAAAPPVSSLPGQGDHTTTLNILAAVLVALRIRDQTGEGQRVEVSLQQTGLWSISNQLQQALLGEDPPPKQDRTAPTNPLVNAYPTRDGRWVNLAMPQLGRDWPRFCAAVDRSQWAEEFPTAPEVFESAVELRARIEERILEDDLEAWRGRFDEAGLLWAPDASLGDVLTDPQLREMDVFETVEHPQFGSFEMLSTPFHIDGADIHIERTAPEVGEHTFEVLTEAGFTAEQIADLGEQGAFG